jgi:hypothetical protein
VYPSQNAVGGSSEIPNFAAATRRIRAVSICAKKTFKKMARLTDPLRLSKKNLGF